MHRICDVVHDFKQVVAFMRSPCRAYVSLLAHDVKKPDVLLAEALIGAEEGSAASAQYTGEDKTVCSMERHTYPSVEATLERCISFRIRR